MILIVDCYLDEAGGTSNFARQLGERSWTSVRPTREALPEEYGWSAVLITGSGACLADGYEGEGLRTGWTQELISWVKRVVEHGIPLLGVCFGHQILGAAFGGGVRKAVIPEVGFKTIHVHEEDDLFVDLYPSFTCFVSHEDEVESAGALQVLASTKDCAIQAVRLPGYRVWGVQFHAEMLLEEATSLLVYRKNKHTSLDVDLDVELEKSAQSVSIAPILFGRFLDLAGITLQNK